MNLEFVHCIGLNHRENLELDKTPGTNYRDKETSGDRMTQLNNQSTFRVRKFGIKDCGLNFRTTYFLFIVKIKVVEGWRSLYLGALKIISSLVVSWWYQYWKDCAEILRAKLLTTRAGDKMGISCKNIKNITLDHKTVETCRQLRTRILLERNY